MAAVTVTFNQPMIPLTSLDLQRSLQPPFQISPRPPGRFRWLGTTTASYESKERFPYSTRYTVTVPAGIRSAVGHVLRHPVRFSFETPRVTLLGTLPSRWEDHALPETPIVLFFDQAVRAEEVLRRTRLLEGGRYVVPMRLVPPERWGRLPVYGNQSRGWDRRRTVVLQPAHRLLLGTKHVVRIDAGLPSAEGPLRTRKSWSVSFRIYGPMRAVFAGCWGYGGKTTVCSPDSEIFVRFTNDIKTSDEELAERILVTPKVGHLHLRASGDRVILEGDFQPATSYRVRVLPGIEDTYGQKSKRTWSASFRLKDAGPALAFPAARGSGVVEAQGDRSLAVWSVNVLHSTVTMVSLPPGRLSEAVKSVLKAGWRERKQGLAARVPGRRVRFAHVFNRKRNRPSVTRLKLDRILHGKPGIVFVEVYSPDLKVNRWSSPRRSFLVQVTNLGLAARYDQDRTVVMATALDTARPLADVRLALYSMALGNDKPLWTGRTDSRGLAVLPGPRKLKYPANFLLVGEKGPDHSFLVLEGSGQDGYVAAYGWNNPLSTYALEPFVTTDRNPYQAGEEVHILGVLRRRHLAPDSTLDLPPGRIQVAYEIMDPRWEKVASGTAKVDRDGTFHVIFRSKPDARLGTYRFRATVQGARQVDQGLRFSHRFKILAYRTPEYEVKVTSPPGPKYLDTQAEFTVRADYLFGAPMAGAPVRWTLTREPTSYQPPGHDDFTFGVPVHSWGWILAARGRPSRWGWIPPTRRKRKMVAKGKGVLDASGRLRLTVSLPRGKGKDRIRSTGRFTLEAQVEDVNRQSIAGRVHVLAHPASLYVGVRWHEAVVKVGRPARLDIVAVDLNGKRLAGVAVTVRALRSVWERRMVRKGSVWRAEYHEKKIEAARCSITSARQVRTCTLTLAKPGQYQVVAQATDSSGRRTITETTLYVAGKGYVPWGPMNQNRVELVPDRKDYAPGQTAKVLLKNPYRHARALVTLEHRGIRDFQVLDIRDSSYVLQIPIRESDVPDLHVSVVLVRGRVRRPRAVSGPPDEDPGRPMFATGHVTLPVAKAARTLRVAVRPAATKVRPGAKLDVTIRTRDHQGRPVPSRLAVFVVDEGVLSLLGFETPDPNRIFLRPAGRQSALKSLRALLLSRPSPSQVTRLLRRAEGGRPTRALELAAPKPRPRSRRRGSLAVATGPAPAPELAFQTRTRFATTAFVDTNVVTDAQGSARLTIPMPENLTAFRIMAVALDRTRPDRFGSGQARVRVGKPLMLRPALPRFANFGDRFEAAVVVNNETGVSGTATVRLDATGVRFLGPRTRTVFVQAGRAAEVRFPVLAARPGNARFRFSAFLGRETDSVEPPPLKVHLPATAEATATYGTTEGSVSQPVLAPKSVLPGFGGIEVSLSSTALTGLQDAASYLVDYPFECAEQTASRLVPIFVLGDLLTQFHIGDLSDKAEQRKLARDGIARLLKLQRPSGGFLFWPGGYRASPYASVYVSWALTQAAKAGFSVPRSALVAAAGYVRRCMDGRVASGWVRRSWSFRAMAAWVLTEMLDLPALRHRRSSWNVSRSLRSIFQHRDRLALFAKAMLMAAAKRVGKPAAKALIPALKRDLDNAAVQTAAAAHFAEATSEELRLLLHSSSRTDAIVLASYVEVAPQDPLIPKIVRGLMDARIKGRWETTQANAFAMYALGRYFQRYERQLPNYEAQVWLGSKYVGSKRFVGRSMSVSEKEIPMWALLEETRRRGGRTELILARRGTGRLYYRIGLRYAPASLKLPPEEQGFAVSRVYEPVADPRSVTRDAKGIWHVKAGSYVRVRLTVVVPDRRYYVAVVDPLPAGFEIVDLDLKTSASTSLASALQRPRNKIFDFWFWYPVSTPDHREIRDDSYQLFWDRLPAGVYEYTYLARATTLGTFVVPPLKAEEMYHPETFGRSATNIVVVEP